MIFLPYPTMGVRLSILRNSSSVTQACQHQSDIPTYQFTVDICWFCTRLGRTVLPAAFHLRPALSRSTITRISDFSHNFTCNSRPSTWYSLVFCSDAVHVSRFRFGLGLIARSCINSCICCNQLRATLRSLVWEFAHCHALFHSVTRCDVVPCNTLFCISWLFVCQLGIFACFVPSGRSCYFYLCYRDPSMGDIIPRITTYAWLPYVAMTPDHHFCTSSLW